jgi:hypothetical protein
MESFMEVDQGPNWGCSAKGKKGLCQYVIVAHSTQYIDLN